MQPPLSNLLIFIQTKNIFLSSVMFPWQCCSNNANCIISFILRLLIIYVPKICRNMDKPICLHILEILLVRNLSSFGVNYISKQDKSIVITLSNHFHLIITIM
jgi:hypothetical protein